MVNFLKKDQSVLRGLWIASGSATAAEIAGHAGFDWLLLDGEHGLGDENFMLQAIRVLTGLKSCPIVRVPHADSPLIGRVLDFGAGGIMVPGAKTLAEIKQSINRVYYPPMGERGLASSCRAAGFGGTFQDYFASANREIALIIQIENRESVELAEQIAALDGVAGLFIGHSDLKLNLNNDTAAVLEAEKIVLSACRKHHKIPGLLLRQGQSAAPYIDNGFRMIGLGSDNGIMKQGFAQLLDTQLG